jgi:hypothetical protein
MQILPSSLERAYSGPNEIAKYPRACWANLSMVALQVSIVRLSSVQQPFKHVVLPQFADQPGVT